MLKIGKGLKKKKKSKRKKDEELFKPEELEKYRREHQQQVQVESTEEVAGSSEPKAAGTENDEWKKFNALTAGVDNILKKTQGDLDRIKSTSFFQKKAPPPKPEPPKRPESEVPKDWININDLKLTPQQQQQHQQHEAKDTLQIPLEDESESEYEEEEDIFDTSYVDVVASGEIKLAYIPDSPGEDEADDGFDPFDTTAADKIIRGPEVSKKGKKLVSIGSAVEVLTGRVEFIDTSGTAKKSRRIVNQDLLLDQSSVDTNGNPTEESVIPIVSQPKSLLDDLDDDAAQIDEPIDLSVSLLPKGHPPPVSSAVTTPLESKEELSFNLSEFDDLTAKKVTQEPDELDDEFAELAAESLNTVKPTLGLEQVQTQAQTVESNWNAFGDGEGGNVNNDDDLDFNPRSEERKPSSVNIHITNPSGKRESISSLEHVEEDTLNSLKPIHRDLLGGSTTDLSKLANQPLAPSEPECDQELSYTDPFDTSIIDQINLPGKTELKFIEAELLGDTKSNFSKSLSDPDFDPRGEEEPISIEPVNVAAVFPVPIQPAQPVKVEPKVAFDDDLDEDIDPFDTSFVSSVAPGKAELKLIESDLAEFEPTSTVPEKLQQILSDPEKLSKPIVPPQSLIVSEPKKEAPDLLFVEEEVDIKALTPAVDIPFETEFDLSYSDPFDTSVACNILPGRAELKLLENELLNTDIPNPKPSVPPISSVCSVLAQAVPPPRPKLPAAINDLLTNPDTDNNLEFKPLTPQREDSLSKPEEDEIDPFDTSIATTLAPGKIELKLIESELIH